MNNKNFTVELNFTNNNDDTIETPLKSSTKTLPSV